MGVGFGLYMYDVVVKRSRSLSHLLMSSCTLQRLTQHNAGVRLLQQLNVDRVMLPPDAIYYSSEAEQFRFNLLRCTKPSYISRVGVRLSGNRREFPLHPVRLHLDLYLVGLY